MKVDPEDFEVEEVPAYAPSGDGEHLFLWVQKRGIDTPTFARELAHALSLPEREVSYAGLKDKQAVTRQFFSVPAKAEPLVSLYASSQASVLWHKRHRNKLRTGHLRGNRFRIRVRRVERPEAAAEVSSFLSAHGFPNFFGEQRFGREGNNAALGKDILLGKGRRKEGRFQRRLYLSAFQSLLFNRALEERIRLGELEKVKEGDLLKKLDSGGQFICEDVAADQLRLERFELSPTGPLFGHKMPEPGGQVAERERALLAAEGLTRDDFRVAGGEGEGARREFRLPFRPLELAVEGSDLWISFELPKGSYATVVMREFLKDSPRHA